MGKIVEEMDLIRTGDYCQGCGEYVEYSIDSMLTDRDGTVKVYWTCPVCEFRNTISNK